MAEPNENGSLSLSTGLFTLGLKGGNALFFFLLIMLAANIAVTLYENLQRSMEHKEITCVSKLSLYIYTTPKGAPIDWDNLPIDTFGCIPKFLFDRPAAPRK